MHNGAMRVVACLFLLVLLAACGDENMIRRGDRDAGNQPRDAGPPPGRDGGPDGGPTPDQSDVVGQAAIVMSSCLGGAAGPLLLSAYGTEAGPNALPELLLQNAVCLATNGGGCDAVDACLGIELEVAGDCTAGCDGDVAVLCGASHTRWRCADVGLSCVGGQCVDDAGSCIDPGSCDGQTPVQCVMGLGQRGPDCAANGLSCSTGSGVPACAGAGAACTPDTTTTDSIDWFGNAIECMDGTLSTCINGMQHDVACSDILPSMTCRMTSDIDMRPFCGIGNACNPFTSVVEFCSGNDIQVCNAGRLQSVRCADLGFTRCATGRCE